MTPATRDVTVDDIIDVTVDDIIDAANENGYIHCRGSWFRNATDSTLTGASRDDNPITAACIMGQIALNLGVSTNDLENQLNRIKIEPNNFLKQKRYMNRWGVVDAAIYYNDNTTLSYNKIAAKLIAWLEPHRGKKFRMAAREYIAIKKGS